MTGLDADSRSDAEKDPSESGAADSAGKVDPRRLQKLIERATSLRESGDTSYVQNALLQLKEGEREVYRTPLFNALWGDSPSSSEYQTNMEVSSAWVRPPSGEQFEPPQDYQPPQRVPAQPKKQSASRGDRLPPPERIGKFNIRGELGRGAFGTVYLGRDDELEREVAIKVSHVADADFQRRLRIEATKLAQVESPGIIPVYQIGETDEGKVYLVTKYIQGLSLRDVLKNGPLSPARAATLMLEMAIALEPAHLQNILHRDLKPDNVLIEKNGWPWIADFGLAISEEEQQAGTRRTLAGTPPYMSPEQITGRVDFMDPRSDIWALGVMFYEMLCGKLPFPAHDRQGLVEQICELDPRPLHQRAPGLLTEAMNDIFLNCCAKKPADRYATVKQLAQELEVLITEGLSNHNIHGQVSESQIGDSQLDFEPSTRLRSSHSTLGRHLKSIRDTDSTEARTRSIVSSIAKWTVGALGVVGLSLAATMYQSHVASLAHKVPKEPTIEPSPASKQFSNPGEDALGDRTTAAPLALGDPQIMEAGEVDGSTARPWVVAAQGAASHRTLSQAVADASAGDLILVMGGLYDESIRIDKSLTIEGRQVSQGEKHVCAITGPSASPLTVACPPNQKVCLRNFAISGLGHRTSNNECNAVDLVSGQLLLESCQLRSHSFNCIKVREDASLEVRRCDFIEADQFAISTKDHESIAVRDSNFVSSGIQMVGGRGEVDRCDFYGAQGIYVSHSSLPAIVTDCKFEGSTQYGISCSNHGVIKSRHNRFIKCDHGIRIGVTDPQAAPGKVELNGDEFLNCEAAGIDVQGGVLQSLPRLENPDVDKISIQGGNVGISVTGGGDSSGQIHPAEVRLSELTLAELRWGIKVTGPAKVHLTDCALDQCLQRGIQLEEGRLELRGVKFHACAIGIMIGSEERWPAMKATANLQSIEIRGSNAFGIAAYSGPVVMAGAMIDGGIRGVFVKGATLSGPEAGEPDQGAPVSFQILRSEFSKQTSKGVFAEGNSKIQLDEATYRNLANGTECDGKHPAEIEVFTEDSSPLMERL